MVSLAISIASRSSANGMTHATGPKISSLAARSARPRLSGPRRHTRSGIPRAGVWL